MFALLFVAAAASQPSPKAEAAPKAEMMIGEVCQIDVHGSINPGTGDYIIQSIKKANDEGCGVLVMTLNTPGGLLSTTRDIVQALLGSPLPVVVFVSPAGALAGSAGVFVTLAANVAAMASGTNIGAAHPVTSGGKDIDSDSKDMAKKVENDTVAFMESIANERHRNKEWAVKAVRESVSVTSQDALAQKVVDLVVRDEKDLYDKLDGRTVILADRAVVLQTRGKPVRHIGMSISQKMVSAFADPQVSYIFMTFGTLGLLLELYHPGAILPGVVGGISLVLAFVSFQVVPINWGGALLIMLGIALMALELVITSHSLLAISGAICTVLGGLLLVNVQDPKYFIDPSFALHLGQVLPLGVAAAAMGIYLATVVVRLRLKGKPQTGKEALIGMRAEVKEAIAPDNTGLVLLHGEIWRAVSDETLAVGATVTVVEMSGLKVRVKS